MTALLRVLIVDDHPIVRNGLKQALGDWARVGDIGEAGNEREALELVNEREWDVVVLDLGLPGRGGLDALKEINRARPRLPVLILSMYPEEQFAVRMIRAGAAGYLTKEAATDKLIDAIEKVVGGGRFISPKLAEHLAMHVADPTLEPLHASLSDREFEVLRLIASGFTVGEIADKLALSVKTVSTYRARVLEKMRMKNNAELMQYALTNQLLD